VVQKGQTVRVKLIERDERGRLRLSMKALEPKPEGMTDEASNGGGENGNGSGEDRPRREFRGDRGDRPRGDRERSGSRGGPDRGDRGDR
jgi:polyribonucleotide nucleotidyltransferase